MDWEQFIKYCKERLVIYHGTTKSFLEKSVERWGRLQNEECFYLIDGLGTLKKEPLYLTDSLTSSGGYAIKRAKAYDTEPTILAINTKLISQRFIFDGSEPRIKFLNQNEYVSLTFREDKNIDQIPSKIQKMFKDKFGFFMW